MNYKLEDAIKRNKPRLIICSILWLFLAIVFVAPFSYTLFESTVNGRFELEVFMEQFAPNIMNPFATLGGIFTDGVTHDFVSLLLGFTIVYLILFFVGFSKSTPKNEFKNIEHGSSDWSQRGEQYQILSKNSGIVLAENNYLPLDKRGNVNVLVVGRIRIW
ncbi:MAG: hypothetical protein IJE05_07715 [Clostridia bacterium]|nr:hypothetical protein [Clostridia bacterium]